MHQLEQKQQDPPSSRRTFLKLCIHGLGAAFAAVLGIPAVAYLLDPRHRSGAASGFKTVAKSSELIDGIPYQAVVRDVRRDAWTIHPSDVIGRVWLIKRKEAIEAFTTVCPHLGCSINFEEQAKRFLCPCHGGSWNLEGERLDPAKNPSPRGMDRLECRRDPANAEWVQVNYQQFMQGRETPVPKT